MRASRDFASASLGRMRSAGVFSGASIVPVFLLIIVGCGNLPRDPESTLERINQKHQIRVGLVENPPWVIRPRGEPAGLEVELVRRFSSSLGANPKWFWGSEQKHMQALEEFELDLVISGMDNTTPWSKYVGLTRPYFEEQFTVGVPSGTHVPDELRKLKIAVPEGDAIAGYVRRKGAIAVRTGDIWQVDGPLVAPDWLLHEKGFIRTKFVVFEKKHVIAVPPGENGWLKRLSDYLDEQKPKLGTLFKGKVQP